MNTQTKSIRDTFGIDTDQTLQVPVVSNELAALVPQKISGYQWDRRVLRDILTFWQLQSINAREIAMSLRGHTGAGKSSAAVQFHACMGQPLLVVNAHPRMESRDLIGGLFPTEKGTLGWVDGPVTKAARLGISVLIDEYNVLDPGEATGLNTLLLGQRLDLQCGTLIPKAGFRVFATANPADGVSYRGRNRQDIANDDRFTYTTNVDYLQPDLEMQIVVNVLLAWDSSGDIEVLKSYAENFVKVANQIRKSFIGSSDSADALEMTMSTTTLLSWVHKFCAFKGGMGDKALSYALDCALTNRCNSTTRLAIQEIAGSHFGFEVNAEVA